MTEKQIGTDKPAILYEDSDLILINKPSGLLSVPDGYDLSLPHVKSVLQPAHGEVWIVHRLDKETSGVLLIARNASVHRDLNESFRLRRIEKIYHGLVTPLPTWREMDIQLPLLANADRKHRTRANAQTGKIAHSVCQVKKWFQLGVLMEIRIHTGISHQIRAHLRASDLSILGDTLYHAGLPPQPFQVSRTMLHARHLGFTHPSTGKWIRTTAPYQEDFRAAYNRLKLTKAQDVKI